MKSNGNRKLKFVYNLFLSIDALAVAVETDLMAEMVSRTYEGWRFEQLLVVKADVHNH